MVAPRVVATGGMVTTQVVVAQMVVASPHVGDGTLQGSFHQKNAQCVVVEQTSWGGRCHGQRLYSILCLVGQFGLGVTLCPWHVVGILSWVARGLARRQCVSRLGGVLWMACLERFDCVH